MKNNTFMLFILTVLILANMLVYIFGVNTILVIVVVVSSIASYKAFVSEEFTDIFNIHSFKYTLTSNNKLELAGSFLASLIVCKDNLTLPDVNITDLFLFILTGLLIYRFLFFNLSKKGST